MEYLTMPYWESLARARGVRLPYSQTKLTTGWLESWLRKLGLKAGAFVAWMGLGSLRAVVEANQHMSARAFAGVVLEYAAEAAALKKAA